MAPLQALGALKETRVGFGSNNSAVLASDGDELANESSCKGPTDCVMDINPDSACV
jgi:hypothetical protein